jgi:ElaB/YqjD/DUF883 family membrane-anchored ribosome-binding protein
MNDVRSPEQIERDINELRAQISDTLDAVQQKLSPGQLLDQALTYARDGGAVAADIGRGMRDNPVPAAIFGISLGWLWYTGSRSERKAEETRERVSREASERLERARLDLLDARDVGVRYVRDNPLTAAAAALAAGALIGALLPGRRK